MLGKLADPSVRVYVVWVPMNRALEREVPSATKEIWDARATHYWDANGQLIESYRAVLGGFNEPVWDTFILYGPDAKWDEDRPPVPAYWMHQLGSAKRPRVTTGPFWNPETFRLKALSLKP